MDQHPFVRPSVSVPRISAHIFVESDGVKALCESVLTDRRLANANATIAHMLTWMPQYSGTSDFWGNYVANGNYNALQISLAEREHKGLTFNVTEPAHATR